MTQQRLGEGVRLHTHVPHAHHAVAGGGDQRHAAAAADDARAAHDVVMPFQLAGLAAAAGVPHPNRAVAAARDCDPVQSSAQLRLRCVQSRVTCRRRPGRCSKCWSASCYTAALRTPTTPCGCPPTRRRKPPRPTGSNCRPDQR
jgi:hypothetical protein